MSGRLIVLGATGTIGSSVVGQALADGRDVIAVARDRRRLAALRRRHGRGARLATLSADIAADADAARLAAHIQALGDPTPGGMVVAIGGHAPRGRLLESSPDLLRQRLDEDLLPHLSVARHLMPLVARTPGATCVLLGGPDAKQPWAGYGHRSVAAAALLMLARVLHDEARVLPLRVRMLVVDAPVRTAGNARHACAHWPDADAVAREALDLLDGGCGAPALVHFPPPAGEALSPAGIARGLLQRLATTSPGRPSSNSQESP